MSNTNQSLYPVYILVAKAPSPQYDTKILGVFITITKAQEYLKLLLTPNCVKNHVGPALNKVIENPKTEFWVEKWSVVLLDDPLITEETRVEERLIDPKQKGFCKWKQLL